MTKSSILKTSNSDQVPLGLPSKALPFRPRLILGLIFQNDGERRKYFLEKLTEKLKDPDFRKIEASQSVKMKKSLRFPIHRIIQHAPIPGLLTSSSTTASA